MEEMKSVLDRLSEVMDKTNVNAVFGEPKTIEGRTLIPVAAVSYGLGLGFGGAPTEAACTCDCEPGEEHDPECDCACHDEQYEAALGGGGGAGGTAHPVAYIEIGPEGTHVQSIVNEQKVALAGILLSMWAVGWIGLVLKTIFAPRR